jgi:hypothetical protein
VGDSASSEANASLSDLNQALKTDSSLLTIVSAGQTEIFRASLDGRGWFISD